ncbi:Uma2 family endonuclease [Ancylothrix sp. C2]|uniref:Uma2 family endonuclease n=1 Tax=Ancylothrix sp. D3o TaxID=2953691 RepID=UPI0021BB5D90|nr:Uma2 family endonuclease [Ancylothrix sp. D3o]MCT7951826.1 Uma2 family endonuclease [Ancylothrix sp. D3o]
MNQLQTKLSTNTWIPATWDEYIQAIHAPEYEKAKTYYVDKKLKIEMAPVGPNHANENGIIFFAISLFCVLKGIRQTGLINCSFRKTGLREAQPDISYYIGERASLAPTGTSIANLEITSPPDLAIEIASTSLADDLGYKRLLYEEMEIKEYWVVDVEKTQIIAFAIAEGGSKRITTSQVLPALSITILEEALQRSQEQDHTEIGTWLLAEFQK